VQVSGSHVSVMAVVLTYGPDTSLDLYLSISFAMTFFIAYLATSCVMIAVLDSRGGVSGVRIGLNIMYTARLKRP
jgi:hypothetical protein